MLGAVVWKGPGFLRPNRLRVLTLCGVDGKLACSLQSAHGGRSEVYYLLELLEYARPWDCSGLVVRPAAPEVPVFPCFTRYRLFLALS
jgi:hypothetical protein